MIGVRRIAAAAVMAWAGATWAEDQRPPAELRMQKDIAYLASDECEGRGPGTAGIDKAAAYIADSFKASGLKPAAADGSYFQPFTILERGTLGPDTAVTLKGPGGKAFSLQLNKEFRPIGLTGNGKAAGGLVFAGYSVVAPEAKYDDFAGLDVAGKVVIVIRRTPRYEDKARPFVNVKDHAPLIVKCQKAEDRKAAAVLLVNDASAEDDELMKYVSFPGGGGVNIPVCQMKRSQADLILSAALGKTLGDIERGIDDTLTPASAPLPEWTAEVAVSVATTPAKNVVGVLPGAGPLADETVVVGAHYDHLGYGGRESGSMERRDAKPAIHPGADDNGSGTTAIMELARRFGAVKDRQGRRLVFVAFSGEEKGLLGSVHYVKAPSFPLAGTAAMVNLDMVGRLATDEKTNQGVLTVYGTGSGKGLDALVERVNEKYRFKLKKVPTGLGPSDQTSFYVKGIPVLFLFTGLHKDYHRPGDTADKVNLTGMAKITDMVEELTGELAGRSTRPEFVKAAGGTDPDHGSPGATGGSYGGPVLKVQFDYGDAGPGVLLTGVTEGGPGDKGGLKGGDRITEIAGKPVRNITQYMSVLTAVKRGSEVELMVERDGKKLSLKVTPQ